MRPSDGRGSQGPGRPHWPCEADLYSSRNSSNRLCLVVKVPFLYVEMMYGQRCFHCVCEKRERRKGRERKREREREKK